MTAEDLQQRGSRPPRGQQQGEIELEAQQQGGEFPAPQQAQDGPQKGQIDCSGSTPSPNKNPNNAGTVPLRARVYMGLVSGLSMGKIAKEASCSRSTVHGIAMTLQRQGILQRIKGSRHPVLFERGPKANDLEVLKDINRRGRAFGLERGPDAPDGATPNIGPARYRTIASGARCPTGPNPNNQAGLMELETGGRVHTVQLSISLDRPYSWSEVKRAFLSVKDTHLLHDVVRHECTYIGKDGPVRLAIQGPKLVLYMPSIVVRSWGDLQTWFDYSASRIEALKVELKERAGLVLGKVSMPRLHCAFTELGEAYNLLFEKVPVDFRLPSVWMDCSLGPPEIEVGSYKLALTMYLLPALVDDLLTKDAEKAEKIRELEDQLQAMRKKGGAP